MQVPPGDMVFSDMRFRDFGADNCDCYRIEDSNLYRKSLRHLGYKSVEFVVYNSSGRAGESMLIFVEAKTTLRPQNSKSRFSDEIADISQKFMDSLQIICGIWHGGRKGKTQLPANFAQFYESGKKIVFALVVKNSEKRELLTVADAIYRKLLKERRLWKFDVKVLNEELSQKENLVLAEDSI
ncbi:MAG: hypothetical protein FWC73_05245 [Defluviitaleaceae bacterium]|nr:hypothetical protein [Defluviitaleaceae bacterium]